MKVHGSLYVSRNVTAPHKQHGTDGVYLSLLVYLRYMLRFFRGLIRRVWRFVKRVLFVVKFLSTSVADAFSVDIDDILRNSRLFLGSVMILVGVLSFSSDRYCDGNASSYYACTRPSTYYFYPWWAIALVVVGSTLTILWFLRRQRNI